MTDTQQFEGFMEQYQDMVFATALRLVGNAAEAEDLSQETFLKAFEHFSELRGSPTAGGWLKTVVTNMSLNHLKRYRARWSFFSELKVGSAEHEPTEPEFPSPENLEESLELSDDLELVERALLTLPAAQRVPLVLYHIEGLRYEEIARKLNISLGKVKTDIFRGRDALRQKLRQPLLETFPNRPPRQSRSIVL
jgi:RNA polymerase sigma-70 factor, ECF subfamily